MPDRKLIIIGGGGHARVVAETALLSGWKIAGHISLHPANHDMLGAWLGTDEAISSFSSSDFALAIGVGFVDKKTAERRSTIVDFLPHKMLTNIIHPSAIVARSACVDTGVFVAAGAIVGTDTHLGLGTLINSGAIIDHDCRVEKNAHVATGTCLSGNVTIGENSLVGAGSVVRQGAKVGANSIVGAGSVVLGDVPDRSTWVGNPARQVTEVGKT